VFVFPPPFRCPAAGEKSRAFSFFFFFHLFVLLSHSLFLSPPKFQLGPPLVICRSPLPPAFQIIPPVIRDCRFSQGLFFFIRGAFRLGPNVTSSCPSVVIDRFCGTFAGAIIFLFRRIFFRRHPFHLFLEKLISPPCPDIFLDCSGAPTQCITPLTDNPSQTHSPDPLVLEIASS